jgi:type VI secretion system secreted protein VgrG
MATITQAGQPISFATPLGADKLLLDRFQGEERISAPFLFTVDLLSEDEAVKPADVLRKSATLSFVLPDGSERTVNGLVRRFAQLGQRDQLTYYRAEVVPWLWFLSLAHDIRIFQNMSVLEIVEAVFKAQGFTDFDIECSRSYPQREYCVQYRESNLNFVSRLLEEEGIFYFFRHTSSSHVLVLADDNDAVEPSPGGGEARLSGEPLDDEDVVLTLADEHAVHIGKVTLTDYDYLQPSLNLQQTVAGETGEEAYDFPGLYAAPADGDRYALIRLQQQEAQARVLSGEGTMRAFGAGSRFKLVGHYRRDVNAEYLLTAVRHRGQAGSYRAWEDRKPHYENSFTAIPFGVPFRPACEAVKPTVRGSQTALVVGPSGEEIWVDSHARVKVQFHWDREGGKDENSSCWVRVASSWAGKAWGWIQIPRIGQEVIVDFLEGDADRPIITGRVYNAEQVPPYDLPANQTQSGVKSRSSKSGGTDNFNEIRLEDLKGSEQIYIHAEKDKKVVVENNRVEDVGNNETIAIGNDRSERVGNNEAIAIGNNQSITVSTNQTVSVGKNQTISAGSNQSTSVGKNRSVDVGDNHTESVGKNQSSSIGKNSTLDIGDSWTVKVSKDHKEETGKNYSLKAKQVYIEGKDQVEIKSGSASIILKKNGDIQIKGGKINIKGSGDVVIKGSKIGEN